MLGGGQGVIPRLGKIGAVFPGLAVPPRRHDDLRTTRMNRPIEAPGIVGPVAADTRQWLSRVKLGQQFFHLGGIALTVVGHFYRPDIQRHGIDGQIDLTPSPAVLGAVLFDFPFALTTDFDPGAVDQQVQRFGPTLNRNVDGQGGLPSADRAEAGHRPVQSQQLQHTAYQASRLPQRKLEQDLQRQHRLNGRVGLNRWAPIGPGTSITQPRNIR